MSVFVQQEGILCDFNDNESWVVLSPIEQSIKRKIESVGTPLRDWNINIYRGVLTGCNEAFIISTEKRDEILFNCKSEEERAKTAELIRPILRGRDIKRYGYNWADLWLIATFPSCHYDIEEYPVVKAHLLSYGKERLEQTGKTYTVNGEKIKARKKTNNKWFETQDSISYWEDFFKPKIVYMEIQTDNPKEGYPFPCFSYDDKGTVALNTAYIMSSNTIDVRYILGILNSSLGGFLSKLYVTQLQQRQFRMLAQYVTKFPLPIANNRDIQKVSELVDKILEAPSNNLEEALDLLVFNIYGLSAEEQDFITNNTF